MHVVLRLFLVALCAATIFVVLDVTRSVATSTFVATPLASSWSASAPASLAKVEMLVATRVHPLLWDPVLTHVLALPTRAPPTLKKTSDRTVGLAR